MAVGDAEEQLLACVQREPVEMRRLQTEGRFVVCDGARVESVRDGSGLDVRCGAEERGAARDAHTGVVRRLTHGPIHLGDRAVPERTPGGGLAFAVGDARLEESDGAAPDERLAIVRADGERVVARLRRPRQRHAVTGEAREDVGAHDSFEVLAAGLSGCRWRDRGRRRRCGRRRVRLGSSTSGKQQERRRQAVGLHEASLSRRWYGLEPEASRGRRMSRTTG
jgi:hypothetical protein